MFRNLGIARGARLWTTVAVTLALVAASLAVLGSASAHPAGGPIVAAPTSSCAMPGCSIHLSTSSGSYDNKVKVTMKNYYPNDFGQVWFWDGVTGTGAALVASGSTGMTGDFSLSFKVPVDPVGKYVVYVTDFTGDNQSAAFNLTHLHASPRTGTASSNFHVGLQGFMAHTTMSFTIDGVNAPAVSPCRTNAHGNVSLSSCVLYVPNISAGTYTLVATDGTNFARVQFVVT